MRYVILLAFFALISCDKKEKKQEKQEKENIKINYTNDGLKKSEYSYIVENSDTLFDGYYKEFYANGNVKVFREYSKGLRQGKVIGYYENNNLKYTGSFDNNNKDGEFFSYYDLDKNKHEKLKIKEKWFDGMLIHNKYEYDENMNLEAYYFYNLSGEIYYNQIFSREGEVVEEEGSKTPVIYVTNNKKLLKVDDTLKVFIFSPMPPKCKVNVSARVKGYSDDWEHLKVNFRDNQIVYKKAVDSIGDFRFEVKSNDSCDDKDHINAIDFTVEPKETKIQLLEKDKKI